jgi:RHS repeat-associated protein
MSGDRIDVYGKSYYNGANSTSTNYTVAVLDLLNGLFGAPTSVAGTKGTAAEVNSLPTTNADLSSFIGDGGRNAGTVPKAAINWILLDEQFHYVKGGYSNVSASAALKDHAGELSNISVTKNGYLYVYCSNQSPVPVYFDNVQVVHTRGPIVEETHYYPFGTRLEAICSKAASSLVNKYQFTGKERQSGEFSDGSGLEVYDYGNRMYDNQLGRWMTIDPLADKYVLLSTYHFTANNPIRYTELDGRYFVDSKGNKVAVSVNKGGQVIIGKNASADLKRMANLVNSSGSKSAVDMFNKLGNNETKINFKIETTPKDNGLLGLHQAHDKDGPVKWEAGTGGTGKFEKMPDYVKGKDGKYKYREASITIFEGNFDKGEIQYQRDAVKDQGLTKEDMMVATFTHEGFHDIDQETIDAIKTRQQGGTNNYDVEKAAETKAENKVYEEVKKKNK